MKQHFVVTGTDTGIGKTVFAAALTQALDAHYWKPVQAGLEDETDSAAVARMAGIGNRRIVPEAYRLKLPASPHHAADMEGVHIDASSLIVPDHHGPLVIEGAGGALVPVNHDITYADIFANWGLPVIIVARTSLGTINHSLLTIEALKARKVPVLGVAFCGDEQESSQRIITQMGEVRSLGRLPFLDDIAPQTLARAFANHFQLADFV